MDIYKNYKSGIIKNNTGYTYYKIYNYNISNIPPILFINGGPGSTHKYLLSLHNFTKKIPLIFYDQYQCGKSKLILKKKINIDLYVRQIEDLLTKLKIKKIQLLGHSWGTILALEYYLRNKENVKNIIFYSPCLSIPLWQKQANFYLKNIKSNIDDNYNKKYIFNDIHILKNFTKNYNTKLYSHLWGKSEYNVNGLLKNYDKTNKLSEINIPVLYLCGKNETASPKIIKYFSKLTKNSNYIIFKNSQHIAHLQEINKFKYTLNFFYKKNIMDNIFYKLFQIIIKQYNYNLENISNSIIVFYTIKFLFPHIYKKYNISKYLKECILIITNNKLKNNREPSTLHLYNLQKYLDFWYFTKLLNQGFGDKFKINSKYIQYFFSKINTESKNNPFKSLLYWIYIKILKVCDKNQIIGDVVTRDLINEIKKNTKIYGYYLTHVVLYDNMFGKRENSNNVKKKISNKINEYILQNNTELKNNDLLSEFIISQYMLHKKIHPKLIRIFNINYKSYHELCVIALATLCIYELK